PLIRPVAPDALHRFHAARYVPGNVVLAAAGSVDHDALCALAHDVLADRAGAPLPHDPVPPGAQGAATRFVAKPTEQVHVCLGGRGVARDDDRRYALRVVDTILGANESPGLLGPGRPAAADRGRGAHQDRRGHAGRRARSRRRALGARRAERRGDRPRRGRVPHRAGADLAGARPGRVIRVAVAGAAGRMGEAVCAAVEAADDLELTGRADPALDVELTDVLGD